jgi:hypothetical protein
MADPGFGCRRDVISDSFTVAARRSLFEGSPSQNLKNEYHRTDSSVRRSSVANSSAKFAHTPRRITRLVFQEIIQVKKDGIKGKKFSRQSHRGFFGFVNPVNVRYIH